MPNEMKIRNKFNVCLSIDLVSLVVTINVILRMIPGMNSFCFHAFLCSQWYCRVVSGWVEVAVRCDRLEAGERGDVMWRSLSGRVGLMRSGSVWY
jgi:hypothetical protein